MKYLTIKEFRQMLRKFKDRCCGISIKGTVLLTGMNDTIFSFGDISDMWDESRYDPNKEGGTQ